ncbi:transcriptional regulatory protein WalR [Aedoeadaptatus coxii]|uniref:Transcriptional regulatory protein WalR n=1 Tax=Aedoeadaptatus coxii TaxID=755172 RepID=A0A134AI14_9FIRM|nr:response regulator transcription factor [Peptoniphilus coxii]KXB67346.1 transcriptional regulatory protein WalR [Peptoniphilus coxii]CAC9933803.1 transcriptional regulatory protein WalR [Peptoniphilus coxii]
MKILITEDEAAIAEIIAYNLSGEGYETKIASDGVECLEVFDGFQPDLVLLDVMMPRMDGFEALREIRKKSRVPVIMLTAKDAEGDRIRGLEYGADDYVVKPFSMGELVARVKANFRRLDFENEGYLPGEVIEEADLYIDPVKYEVTKRGKVVDLTLREFELLKYLAQSPGTVFSREQLLEEVWGYEYYGDIRTVDVTVRRLREKIEDGGDFRYILTKRGVGYYFGG